METYTSYIVFHTVLQIHDVTVLISNDS